MADTQYDRLLALKDSNPAEFYRLMRAVNEKTVHPHPGQRVVLDSTARFRVMNCGRRWGKTVLAAKIIVSRTRKKNQMLWWVAPTYRIVKRGYAEVLRQLPDGVLAHDPPPETHFDAGRPIVLRFKNGTKMEFYSAERPEGMLGAAVDYAVLDEASKMPTRVWNQIVSPTLIDHLGGALMISTPSGRNWFYDVWVKGQDPEQTEWESWTFTTQDNPTLPEGEADRMAADMPKMEADQEIYAKWIAAGAQVFAAALANEKIVQHANVLDTGLVEDVKVSGGVFLGVDLARTSDYTVLYGTVERSRQNCYFERWNGVAWSEQRRRIKQAVKRLINSGAEHVTLMVDEGNAGSVIVEDLQEAGFDTIGVNFTTQKGPMVRLLANDLEEGKAFILGDPWVTEFENYSMSATPQGRIQYSAPEGQHDDIVSAKMLSHWGCVNEGFGSVSILETNGDPSGDTADRDPWDDEDDFSDLLDEDVEVFEEIGLGTRGLLRPTPEQLLHRADLWL